MNDQRKMHNVNLCEVFRSRCDGDVVSIDLYFIMEG